MPIAVLCERCWPGWQLSVDMLATQAPPAAAPAEVAFVPSVTIKKDATQALGVNFWASAASISTDAPQQAAPPLALAPAPAASAPAAAAKAPEQAGAASAPAVPLSSVRPPAIAAAALNFWQAASGKPAGELPADARPAAPAPASRPQEPEAPTPITGPSPSQKLAASKFWERAAERTFSGDQKPDAPAAAAAAAAAAPAEDVSPEKAAEPQRAASRKPGSPASQSSGCIGNGLELL